MYKYNNITTEFTSTELIWRAPSVCGSFHTMDAVVTMVQFGS